MDHAAIGAPEYGLALGDRRGRVGAMSRFAGLLTFRVAEWGYCVTTYASPGTGPLGNTSWLHATRKASYQVRVKLAISSSTVRPPTVMPE